MTKKSFVMLGESANIITDSNNKEAKSLNIT